MLPILVPMIDPVVAGLAPAVLLTGIGLLLWRLRGRPRRPRVVSVWAATLVVFGALAVYGRFVEPQWIVTTRHEVVWRGPRLRLGLVADLHAGRTGRGKLERVVARLAAERPDVVVIAGDFISSFDMTAEKREILGALAALRPPLGTFAVLGNHDAREPQVAELLASLGITVLRNRHLTLPNGVVVAGLGEYLAHDVDLAATFDGVAAEAPVLLVTHNWKAARGARFDVAVAGHTHGGQICVPIADWCPVSNADRPYVWGRYAWPDGGTLIVTKGMGESWMEMRLGARPELVIVELVPGGR